MIGRKSLAARIISAVAVSLCLFFLLESAVARRIGLDLILPVSGGVFLPWRLARMVLALALTLLAALRGGKLSAWLDRACARDWARWLLSTAVTALFFLWAMRVTVLSYLICDDVTTIKAIAAIPEQGYGPAAHTFSHTLFCALLGLFYKLAPNGYWYLIYEVGMQLFALLTVGRCILLKTCRRGWPVLTGCVIHAALCAGVFMYTFAALTFTLTAAIAGTAAVALVLCRDELKTRAGRAVSDIGCAVLMALCYLQRSGSGNVLLCFWALAVAYQLIKTLTGKGDRRLRRAAVLAAVALVTFAGIRVLNGTRLADAEPGYWSSESYRSTVMDFLLDKLEPEQFQAAGFPRELATMVQAWFFMDERVNVDSFASLINAYYYGDHSAVPSTQAAGPVGRLLGLGEEFAGYVLADPLMWTLAGCTVALLVLALAVLWRTGRRDWLEFLTALCAAGGALVLSLYLVQQGYFPTRAFQAIMYPTVVTMALAVLSAPTPPEDIAGARRRAASAVCCVCAAALAVLCGAGVYHTPNTRESVGRADLFSDQWQIEAYARSHPDTTIVNNAYFSVFDPLHNADYPKNLVWWGNCGDLAKAPEERMYADVFFRDDVQFMGDSYSTLLFLLQYLTAEYGPVQAPILERVSPRIFITDISLVSPGPDYTGWYEQNGMTYYFEDGEALTGTHTIDGETYTFAPAGADSQLSILTDNGMIYTTDAYSLVTADE